MNIRFEKVLERDIDLLMIDRFINNVKLLELFLGKINLNGYKIVSVEHSNTEIELGESDITIVAEKDNKKIGILIENKINAPAMKFQAERYKKRGNNGIKNNLYDEYNIFIIAPEKYLENNSEAKKYPNKVSYEEILSVLDNDIYAKVLLKMAIEEKENGYIVMENKAVTEFWRRYYTFIKQFYPQVKFHEIDSPRGSKAKWADFCTDYKQVKIIHKSDRGYMDLTFRNMASYKDIFYKYTEDKINSRCKRVETGKSMAIRIAVPSIDFKSNFDDYNNEMHKCMESALILYDILKKIDVMKMYNEIKVMAVRK